MDKPEEDGVTAVSEPTKTRTIDDLRKCGQSLFIRNNTALPWHLHDRVNGNRIDIELKPNGRDGSICYLPSNALELGGVTRNFHHGKISIGPELEAEMLELMGGQSSHVASLLDQYDTRVEASPQSRAIDVNSQVEGYQENMDRAVGIRTQAQQQLVTGTDGNVRPKTDAELEALPTKLTITRPMRVPEGQEG